MFLRIIVSLNKLFSNIHTCYTLSNFVLLCLNLLRFRKSICLPVSKDEIKTGTLQSNETTSFSLTNICEMNILQKLPSQFYYRYHRTLRICRLSDKVNFYLVQISLSYNLISCATTEVQTNPEKSKVYPTHDVK